MSARALADFARRNLDPQLRRQSGQILYSGAATVGPGRVYLLGHNPGGSPTDRKLLKIGESIRSLPKNQENSYLDTEWSGRDTLQVRVIWLLSALGLHPRDVAASNLCFARSRDARTSNMWDIAAKCWPVHEQILKMVHPRLIIAYGNSSSSPYAFLSKKFGAQKHEQHPSGHGDWMCRRFAVRGRPRVVGLPHLSRYDITVHCDVIPWIKEFL